MKIKRRVKPVSPEVELKAAKARFVIDIGAKYATKVFKFLGEGNLVCAEIWYRGGSYNPKDLEIILKHYM